MVKPYFMSPVPLLISVKEWRDVSLTDFLSCQQLELLDGDHLTWVFEEESCWFHFKNPGQSKAGTTFGTVSDPEWKRAEQAQDVMPQNHSTSEHSALHIIAFAIMSQAAVLGVTSYKSNGLQ